MGDHGHIEEKHPDLDRDSEKYKSLKKEIEAKEEYKDLKEYEFPIPPIGQTATYLLKAKSSMMWMEASKAEGLIEQGALEKLKEEKPEAHKLIEDSLKDKVGKDRRAAIEKLHENPGDA